MMLLIDSGNTYIKWTLVNGDNWLEGGRILVEQAEALSQHLDKYCEAHSINLHDVAQIWVSNVAGEAVARHISNIVTGNNAKLQFVIPQAQQCSVRNGYSQPDQLGSDRWAALLGAWHLMKRECLVLNCGTATTIDALSAKGEFIGGLILPGVELMLSSLCASTSQLIPSKGNYDPFPKNTADAMFSGMVQASCGAIQRQYALLGCNDAPLVLSGGAAGILQKHITYPVRAVDDLVLQGLLLIAKEAGES